MMMGTSGRAALALGNSSRPVIPGMLNALPGRSHSVVEPCLRVFISRNGNITETT
jgi:hypothetical protein